MYDYEVVNDLSAALTKHIKRHADETLKGISKCTMEKATCGY